MLGLKWDAVDFANDEITIKHTVVSGTETIHLKDSTKNDSSNAPMPMSKLIKQKLLAWQTIQEKNKGMQPKDYVDSDYICTHINGELIRPDYVSQHFQILLKKMGMPPIRFHDLRHSSASYLKHLGYDGKDIQTWLRHKDIQTTMNLYTHIDMAAKRCIAEHLDKKLSKLI